MIVGGQHGDVSECRIDDPGQLMRAWSMLKAADQELHKVSLPPGAVERLGRQLQALVAELERSLSPALTGELERLLEVGEAATPTPPALRVEHAGLLGWTSGLVIAMLAQLDNASAGRGADIGPESAPNERP